MCTCVFLYVLDYHSDLDCVDSVVCGRDEDITGEDDVVLRLNDSTCFQVLHRSTNRFFWVGGEL